MIAGTVIMTCSFGLPEFIVGRGELLSLSAQPISHAQISSLSKVISGIGNGFNTATVPALQSELAPPAIRGSLVLISGTLIAVGIAIAYWVSLGT